MTTSPPVEQVVLSRLLELGYQDFERSLLSSNARFVLWGSFESAEQLIKNYLSVKGKIKLADARRSTQNFSDDDRSLLVAVSSAAEEALKYARWARDQPSGQPVLRDMLVSHCTAFEAELKNIALVFSLFDAGNGGLSRRVFIPGDQFGRALAEVKSGWKRTLDVPDIFRGKRFFDEYILAKAPEEENFRQRFEKNLTSTMPAWSTCQAAFGLRNAIVHQLGRPSQQIVVGESVFHPGWDVELTPRVLYDISVAMKATLFPLDPLSILLLD